MIKLVAFDWNGTIYADVSATVRVYNRALYPKLGLKPISINLFRETFEVPIVNYWIKVGFSEKKFKKDFGRIQSLFQRHYELFASKCRTRVGSRKVLAWLKRNNIESIIYSNHIVPEIRKQLLRVKLDNYFTDIIAREPSDNSHLYSRGKAEKLRNFVSAKKLSPWEVISVGDTEEEIEIGKKFGYHTVAITGGWNSTRRLKKHHPDFLIHNLHELIRIIKNLNQQEEKVQ